MSPLINTCTCTARVLQLHRFHSVSTTVTDTAPSVRHQSYKRSVWWTYLSFLHFSNDLLYINSCVCKHHQHLCHHHHQHHQHLCHHHHQHHHYPQFINSQTQRSISSIATTNLVERVKLLYLASLFLAVEQKQRHVSVSSSRHVLPASPVNKHIATSPFCFIFFAACSACFSCQQTHRHVTFLLHLLHGVFCLLLLSTNTSPRHVSASSSSLHHLCQLRSMSWLARSSRRQAYWKERLLTFGARSWSNNETRVLQVQWTENTSHLAAVLVELCR